ncbi:hypothetical protein GTP45_21915 [Pseudoduganella sp. FT55W]|uniref:Uncharacterized protein n=1 Tax=Duganella rivi TaxID=2666083 RepID=A0A7X4GTP3_9BURK|nr:hypothetical protein [Duganella rivi]MYM69476.1 hypothetical protein [Duganella rivi]
MSINAVKSDIAAIASKLNFDPVKIPPHLAHMASMDAIHARLVENIEAIGGYSALAKKLTSHGAKVWQGKIERIGRYVLNTDDFVEMLKLFQDPVLIALLANGQKHAIIHLSPIPPSEYSAADLAWTLSSLSAEGILVCCRLREQRLDGEDSSDTEAEMVRLTKSSIVLLQQMRLVLKSKLEGVRGPDVSLPSVLAANTATKF